MQILQITSGVEINGAVMHCYLLSRELAARGHDVTVMCRRQSWIWNRLKTIGVKRIACNMNRRRSDLAFAQKFVADNKIDVIHTHMSRAHFFGLLLRHLTKVPCVATAHCCHLQFHWRFNDFVIANSNDTYLYQTRFNRVRPHRIKTVYCFSDLEKFLQVDAEKTAEVRNRLGVSQHEFLIGIVGDVIPRKGHNLLFEQLPHLFRKYTQAKLVVIGRYEDELPFVNKLRRISELPELSNRILWTGRTDNVPHYMTALDLCVVPSIAEPLGLVAMEAMASMTPVAAAKVGGLPEIIDHQRTGWLFEPKNSSAIGRAIEYLIENPELRQRFVDNAFHSVNEKFSPAALTAEVEQVLQLVVDQKTGRTLQTA